MGPPSSGAHDARRGYRVSGMRVEDRPSATVQPMSAGEEEALDYEADFREAVREEGRLTVPDTWEGMPGTAFGGFLAAAVLVAASRRTDHPLPLSLFTRFHRPVPTGRALGLVFETERQGRSIDTLRVRLVDGERLLSTHSVAFGAGSEVPLVSQALPKVPALVGARPVWQYVEESGREAPRMMRRVGYRTETEPPPEEAAAGWHLRSEWPAPNGVDPAIHAAVAVLAIDAFVAPATLRANAHDLGDDWPVVMPSLDLTSWFHPPADTDRTRTAGGWLTVRSSVPVTRGGYAVGRTQVFAGESLVAEGMSQVALVPVPTARS